MPAQTVIFGAVHTFDDEHYYSNGVKAEAAFFVYREGAFRELYLLSAQDRNVTVFRIKGQILQNVPSERIFLHI